MALGMEMMLKSMGFDPEALKAEFVKLQTGARDTVIHFDTRLKAIEDRQATIEAHQIVIMESLLRIESYMAGNVPAGVGPNQLEASDGRRNSN